MNSKKVLPAILVLITMLIFSCASKKDDSHGHDHHDVEGENVWKEMDDFHMIMAESFHPYKDPLSERLLNGTTSIFLEAFMSLFPSSFFHRTILQQPSWRHLLCSVQALWYGPRGRSSSAVSVI